MHQWQNNLFGAIFTIFACPQKAAYWPNNKKTIPLLTPLIDPNWINSELAITLVKCF